MDFSWLVPIGKFIVWFISKILGTIIWGKNALTPYVGEAGAISIVFSIIFFLLVIGISIVIAKTQASLENFFAFIMGKMYFIFIVWFVCIIMIFVLSAT